MARIRGVRTLEKEYQQFVAKTIDAEDLLILRHPNGLCVLCLNESSELFQEKIKSVEFPKNRRDVKVAKKMKGGFRVEGRTKICEVLCENGKTFQVRALISGNLIEVNENLVENPNLLTESPSNGGYIAVIFAKPADIAQVDGVEHKPWQIL